MVFRGLYYKKGMCLLIAFVMCVSSFIVPPSAKAEAAESVGSYLAERWGVSIEGAVAAKPVVGEDGTLYVLSRKGKLYALSSAGKQLWTAEVRPMGHAVYSEEGQLELGADGVIYAGSSGNLYAFDANGMKKWEYETSYPSFQKVDVQRNGLIYLQVNSQRLFIALRPDGTKALERTDVTGLVKHTGTTEDKIYITSTKITPNMVGGKLSIESTSYAEELSVSGSSRWKVNLDGVSYNSPSIDTQGNLLVFSEVSKTGEAPTSFSAHYRDPSTIKVLSEGTVKRTYSLAAKTLAPIIFDEQQNAYIVTKDAAISKFDVQGNLLWKLQIEDQADLFENGTAMKLGQDGSLIFYSYISRDYMEEGGKSERSEPYKEQLLKISSDGKLLSSSKQDYFNPTAWLENGMLLSNNYNKVVLLDKQMNKLAEYQTNSPFYLASTAANMIYVGTESGRVIALEIKETSNKGDAVSVSFGDMYPWLEAGQTYLLEAIVKGADGKEQKNSQGIVYRSSNEKIAYFNKSGFHTLKAGEVEITAEYLHLKTTMKVKINERSNIAKPAITYSAQLVKQWSTMLPSLNSTKNERYYNPVISTDGMVYALSSQGKVAAVSKEGKLQWENSTINQLVRAKPDVGPDGRLYVGTNNGQLMAFDLISGKQMLNSTVASNHRSIMFGWDRSGNKYAGFTSNSETKTGNISSASSRIQAIDASDTQLWYTTLSGEIVHQETVFNDSDDTLYVVTSRNETIGQSTGTIKPGEITSIRRLGTLYALSAATGSVRWKYELGSSDNTFYKPLLLQDGTIVTAISQGTVVALDKEGQLKWNKNLKIYASSGLFQSNQKLLLFTSGLTAGLTEGEDPIQYMSINSFPETINQQQEEWLLTLTENLFAIGARHAIASYDAAGKLKWQISIAGEKTGVSGITNNLQVAIIDAAGELSLSDIRISRSTENIFSDMRAHWAKDAVEKLAEAGVVDGFPDGTYRPGAQVTREQFLAMLSKKLRVSYKEAELSFTDVAQTRWSRSNIESAVAYGWIDAKNYGSSFKPAQPVSREEVAVWTAKALGLTEKTAGMTKVSDKSSIDALNLGMVGAVIDSGIMTGYEDGSFKPAATLTRAEAAVLLSRIKG